jgi:hypothetical protein
MRLLVELKAMCTFITSKLPTFLFFPSHVNLQKNGRCLDDEEREDRSHTHKQLSLPVKSVAGTIV